MGLGVVGSPRLDRLPVEYAGCWELLRAGPVCLVGMNPQTGHRSLKLWVEPPPGTRALDFLADGRQVRRFAAVAGLLAPEIPPDARRIELRAETPAGFAVWSLALAPPDPAVTAALRDLPLPAKVAAHRAAGRLQGEVFCATALADGELRNNRFENARRLLDRLPRAPGASADVDLALAYYRALLARQTGDLRSALHLLQDAAPRAARLQLFTRWQVPVAQEQALAYQSLGRWSEAIEIFAALRQEKARERVSLATPCDEGQLLTNEGWTLLMAREAGERAADPVPDLRSAQRLFDSASCKPYQRLNAGINLALARLQEKDPAGARAALADADRFLASAKPDQQLWQLEIEARIDLLAGRAKEALQRYDRMARFAGSAGSPDGLWRAAYGRARALERLGDVDGALAAYGEADRRVDEQSLAIAIAEGRETFMALRQAGTQAYLDLLVRSGRARDAFAATRHARARLLRQLERADRLARLVPAARAEWERSLEVYRRGQQELAGATQAEWQLPTAEQQSARERRAILSRELRAALDRAFAVLGRSGETLVPPGPGEVILAYERLGEGRWAGFAADEREVRSTVLALPEGGALPSAARLAGLLLEPFHDAIERGRRVRVLAAGRLEEVDFHALPFAGDALLATRPVTYSLDLPRRSTGAPGGSRRALLVADPLGNLPEARREARVVAEALGSRGWRALRLTGRAAEATAVKDALGRVDLLHYAGHATVSGSGGWESALELAEGTRLTVEDLLASPRVPPWVVLSGCETGRTAAQDPVATLGLAHAFLLAGARGVIATARPVEDRAALRLFTELYRNWNGQADLAALLRQAQLALRRDPAADWQSFRFYAP